MTCIFHPPWCCSLVQGRNDASGVGCTTHGDAFVAHGAVGGAWDRAVPSPRGRACSSNLALDGGPAWTASLRFLRWPRRYRRRPFAPQEPGLGVRPLRAGAGVRLRDLWSPNNLLIPGDLEVGQRAQHTSSIRGGRRQSAKKWPVRIPGGPHIARRSWGGTRQ